MNWWIWCVLGFVLLVAELITPGGFYLMFFGIAGLAVGAVTFFGFSGPAWLQWVLFSVLSLVPILLFRERLLSHFTAKSPSGDLDTLVGELANAVESIPTGAVGHVSMRGTSWRARNAGEATIAPGQECQVERVEGLMLLVRAR